MSPRPSSGVALRNAKIIQRRMDRQHPAEIAAALDIPENRVRNVLIEAREAGSVFPEIPRRRTGRPPGSSRHRDYQSVAGSDDYRDPKPRRKDPPEELTIDEELRLRELAQRNLGLTAIATLMRKRYVTIDAAMVRLGLSRAGVP